MESNEGLALLNYGKYVRNQFFTKLAFFLIFILVLVLIDILIPLGFIKSLNLPDWQFIAGSALLFLGPLILLKTIIFTTIESFKVGNINIGEEGIKLKTAKTDDFFESNRITKAKIKRKRDLFGKNEIWKVKFNYDNKRIKHALMMPIGKIRSSFNAIQSFNN